MVDIGFLLRETVSSLGFLQRIVSKLFEIV